MTISKEAIEAAETIQRTHRKDDISDHDARTVARALLDGKAYIDTADEERTSLRMWGADGWARADKAEAELRRMSRLADDWMRSSQENFDAARKAQAELSALRQAVREAEGAMGEAAEEAGKHAAHSEARGLNEAADILREKTAKHMGGN